MDAHRFDAVVRALPVGPPRRAVLGGGLAAALASLLGGPGGQQAEAKKKKRKKKRRNKDENKCQAEQIECFGQCTNLGFDPNNCGACGVSCPAGACLNGTCICRNDGECNGCTCGPRKGGGEACLAEVDLASTCVSDGQCPELGSFCTNSDHCTVSCKE